MAHIFEECSSMTWCYQCRLEPLQQHWAYCGEKAIFGFEFFVATGGDWDLDLYGEGASGLASRAIDAGPLLFDRLFMNYSVDFNCPYRISP
jgi:hypothetical protein